MSKPTSAGRPAIEAEDVSVRLGEELTIYQALELYADLERALGGARALELDLSAVEEIDSAGMQVLVRLREQALADDKRLRLTGHSAAVVEALELFNLAAYFGDPLVLPATGASAP